MRIHCYSIDQGNDGIHDLELSDESQISGFANFWIFSPGITAFSVCAELQGLHILNFGQR